MKYEEGGKNVNIERVVVPFIMRCNLQKRIEELNFKNPRNSSFMVKYFPLFYFLTPKHP
jgi:hypothetical protein